MSAKEISEKVIELARERGCLSDNVAVTKDSLLELDLGLDWLDQIELVMDVEEALGIDLHDEDVDELKRVGDLVKAAQRAAVEAAGKEGGAK